jgi:zinc transport system ATP-binding protein
MYNLIQSLNKDGITIIMISHDVLAAIKYATHILHIGKEIFFGTKDEYMNSSVFKKFGGV